MAVPIASQKMATPVDRRKPDKGVRNMWLITLIVIVALVVGLFLCCVILVYSSEIRMTAE